MIGCPLCSKCARACRRGELSQQPTWPQVRHKRRCTHGLPVLRHSSQPKVPGTTSLIASIWLQPFICMATGVHTASFGQTAEVTAGNAGFGRLGRPPSACRSSSQFAIGPSHGRAKTGRQCFVTRFGVIRAMVSGRAMPSARVAGRQLCSIRRSSSSLRVTSRKSSSSCSDEEGFRPDRGAARAAPPAARAGGGARRGRGCAWRARALRVSAGAQAARAASKEIAPVLGGGAVAARRAPRAPPRRARPAPRPSSADTPPSPSSPSRRTSGASVSPCTTSVASTTAKAVSTIRSRCGKSAGSAKAVASVTSPRMPHQPIRTDSRGSAARPSPAERGEPAGEPAVGEHPGHAHDDEADDHRQREAGRLAQASRGHAADDGARLQAHQQEGEHVEQEDRGVPDREAVDARRGRGVVSPAPRAIVIAKATRQSTAESSSRSARIQTPKVADELEEVAAERARRPAA